MTDSAFDSGRFFAQLDSLFAKGLANTDVLPFLEGQLKLAETNEDLRAQLTIICELLGFNRSRGRHAENLQLCERALDLRQSLGIGGTEQSTVVLIDVATAYRAAGDYELAEKFYMLAVEEEAHTLTDSDRRKAALYNNLSMLYSETSRLDKSRDALLKALELMEVSSDNSQADIDIASSLTNLGLLEIQLGKLDDANAHTAQAVKIYEANPELKESAHFSSALAGRAQALFMNGNLTESQEFYARALKIIREKYGESSQYFSATKSNADMVADALNMLKISGDSNKSGAQEEAKALSSAAARSAAASGSEAAIGSDTASKSGMDSSKISGLELSWKYWQACADELFSDEFAGLRSRAAIGLAGHGSECYGFDDEISRDHDFGPRFCVWLTNEDYASYGRALKKRYDELPHEFMGINRSARSPRSSGRDGVMTIDSFFESITGLTHAPATQGEEHLWLNLQESTLAAATNGEIFADPLGAFSSRRNAFKRMPDDVRLYLISQRLGMISQTGQYNYARMQARGDASAAALTLHEFVMTVSSLVFLLNDPASVGYAPYYKWRFAALRKLSSRMATRLPDICGLLENLLSQPSQSAIDDICQRIASELRAQGLSSCQKDFLEWHRPYVEAHISSYSPLLHSI